MSSIIRIKQDEYRADADQVRSAAASLAQTIDGGELQYDTLDATLDTGGVAGRALRERGGLMLVTSDGRTPAVRPLAWRRVRAAATYAYGDEVTVEHDGRRVGKYYLTDVREASRTAFDISCVSAVGILDNSKHYGGIYIGVTLSALVEEIIGGTVPYTVDTGIAGILLYGWLPIATRRSNLHQVLFATGTSVLKDAETGDIYITYLSEDTVTEIGDSLIYMGGSSSYSDPIALVVVNEHNYIAADDDETVTLFEGAVSGDSITTPAGEEAVGAVVAFSEPMHELVPTNCQIIESGVNYAVISPSPQCSLVGKKYTHTVREVRRQLTPPNGNGASEQTVSVTDATLVSVVNSDRVADRLAAFYGAARQVNADFVTETERPGQAVRLRDNLGRVRQGFITSMDMVFSGILKASSVIVTDFHPPRPGNFYDNVAVITSSGTWTVPSGVTQVRIVVIGGGEGGQCGEKGGNGESGDMMDGSRAGNGGDGGRPGGAGRGGRILITTAYVTAGSALSVVIGEGGAGGWMDSSYEAHEAESGGDTTVTLPGAGGRVISSADGLTSDDGYTDPIRQDTYAPPQVSDGIPGGYGYGLNHASGGKATVTADGVTYVTGADGASRSVTQGTAYGGLGGGPAAGADGGSGGRGQSGSNFVEGGTGGNGADALRTRPTAEIPGQGGLGGDGGGGGGGGGRAVAGSGYYAQRGPGGMGGRGGTGGTGADGVCLFYY